MGNSLILDPQVKPIIVYYTEDALKMAHIVDGHWKEEIVEELPSFTAMYSWRSFRSSLVLDSKGFPHIGFESLKGLEHAWWDGKRWHSQLLIASLGNTFYDNAMTIGNKDDLFISYRDPVDGSLKVLVGRPGAQSDQEKPAGK